MKTSIILLLSILAFTASASTDFKASLTNLVNMSSRAVDAVDAALDLLNSLK